MIWSSNTFPGYVITINSAERVARTWGERESASKQNVNKSDQSYRGNDNIYITSFPQIRIKWEQGGRARIREIADTFKIQKYHRRIWNTQEEKKCTIYIIGNDNHIKCTSQLKENWFPIDRMKIITFIVLFFFFSLPPLPLIGKV